MQSSIADNQTDDIFLPSNSTYSSLTVKLKVVVIIFIDIVAIFGNVLVCLSVYENRRLRTKTALLILCLAISDLIFATTVVPMSTASIWRTNPLTNKPVWIADDNEGPTCAIHGILVYSLTGMSIQTMALAALNRYFCIVHSNFYRKHFTFKVIVATLSLMFSTILVLLITISATKLARFHFIWQFTQCFLIFHERYREIKIYTEIAVILIWCLLPLLTIVICYLLIYCHVRRHNRRVGIRLARNSRLPPANVVGVDRTAMHLDNYSFESRANRKERKSNSIDNRTDRQEMHQQDNTKHNQMKGNHKTRNTELSTELSNCETTNQASREHDPTPIIIINQTNSAVESMEQISTRNTNLKKEIKESKSEVKITKVLLAVFLGFCICWVPTVAVLTAHAITRYTIDSSFLIVVTYSAALSTAINPFIYGAANREFRKTYISLFTFKKVM